MADAVLYYEDVEIGDDIGPYERVVTSEQVNEFNGIRQRDTEPNRFNSAEVAKSEGLPGPIVPGGMNIAILSQIITGWSSDVTLKLLDVVFRQVVQHNIPLQLKGIVTDKNVVDGEPQLECDVFIENEEGTRLVIARAIAVLPMRGS